MIFRRLGSLVALLVLAMCAAVGAPGAPSVGAEPTAKAAITFDVDSGKVIDARNDRARVGVASTIKLLTALVVEAKVPMDDMVPITSQAADVSPLKLSMEPGSRWRAGDLLHAMLIASLNDTAMALAIRAGGGSLKGFDRAVAAESKRLGLADAPHVVDPAGLDGPEGVDGGNLISARDLAIVTREFLHTPELAAIVRMPLYRFAGGDGKPHVVYNHNAFLNIYPDAIGVKTGYTDRSGHSLVAAATRKGRTLATVVVDSPDPVAFATAHLDAAFAAGADTPGTGDVLPDAKPVPEPSPSTSVVEAHKQSDPAGSQNLTAQVRTVDSSPRGAWLIGGVIVVTIGVLATLVVGVRRRATQGASRSRRDRS